MIRLLASIALLLAGCSGGTPTPPPSGATTFSNVAASAWQAQYSAGVSIVPASVGWQFAFPATPDSVHYVVAPANLTLNTAQTITAQVAITGNAPVFEETATPGQSCVGTPAVRLFVQQQGDDLSGAGAYAYARWWSNPAAVDLALGTFTLTATLAPNSWSGIFGEQGGSSAAATAGFQTAIAHIGNIGVTFGGCFFGHGADLKSGSAIFGMKGFAAQ